jgi:hypothetical protein
MNKDPYLKTKIIILLTGVFIAVTVILLSIFRSDLFDNETENNKEEFTTKKKNNFPRTKRETKILIDQMVTNETTTYVMGEEGNHDYPISSMCAGSEEYNSNPSPSNINNHHKDYKSSYAMSDNGMPNTQILTNTSSEEGTHNRPCNYFAQDIGGLGTF